MNKVICLYFIPFKYYPKRVNSQKNILIKVTVTRIHGFESEGDPRGPYSKIRGAIGTRIKNSTTTKSPPPTEPRRGLVSRPKGVPKKPPPKK